MGQLLSLENVTLAVEKENSKQAIVKHVSFSISEGEIVALVGESGSGKKCYSTIHYWLKSRINSY